MTQSSLDVFIVGGALFLAFAYLVFGKLSMGSELAALRSKVWLLALDVRALQALNAQSFGLTWQDVALLRKQADHESEGVDPVGNPRGYAAVRQEWVDLADRIAALLPPRSTT